MTTSHDALVQSIKARLVQQAHADRVDPNRLLSRFAIERFLYRLSKTAHGERFILKGAALLVVWLGEPIRATRDADLLGLGNLDSGQLVEIFREACVERVEPDGMIFDPSSTSVRLIRRADPAGGHRVTLLGRLGSARLKVQLDVGLGDAVSPPPEWLDYPTLLGHPSPRMRAYRPETAIAEKLHAMVIRGTRTSRLRDFFDIRALAQKRAFEAGALVSAVRTTFEGRGTALPSGTPLVLTPTFAKTPDKQAQWRAFVRKSGLDDVEMDFGVVVTDVAQFVLPIVAAAGESSRASGTWRPGGPWRG
jgi:hypothetical protein